MTFSGVEMMGWAKKEDAFSVRRGKEEKKKMRS
jgi:hypothetical protein